MSATETREQKIARLRREIAAHHASISAQRPAAPPAAATPTQPLPADLQAALGALRAAGLHFTVLSITPAQPPSPPPREITVDEIKNLDARDPRRTLHQYQHAYSLINRPLPQHIVESLRVAARERQKRRLP